MSKMHKHLLFSLIAMHDIYEHQWTSLQCAANITFTLVNSQYSRFLFGSFTNSFTYHHHPMHTVYVCDSIQNEYTSDWSYTVAKADFMQKKYTQLWFRCIEYPTTNGIVWSPSSVDATFVCVSVCLSLSRVWIVLVRWKHVAPLKTNPFRYSIYARVHVMVYMCECCAVHWRRAYETECELL